MAAETGHHAGRAYIDQDGNVHMNGCAVYNDAEEDISDSLEQLNSLAPTEIGYLDDTVPGTVAGEKAVVPDANKDVGAFRNIVVTNMDAGASGTAGTVDVFPSTASKGKLSLAAADNAGDTTTTITNASQAGARTYTVPDAGASANFLMSEGAQSINGAQTITKSGTGTGAVAQRFGASATEGLEVVVFEDTISPSAVETNVVQVPAGAVILSVQGNVESALTGGGTTVTWSLGTAGDPDKYGTPASDSLAQNSKSNSIPDWAVLGSAEQIVLTGAATGGAADGDTALTVGSVRVRVVYAKLTDLDDA